MEVELLPQDSDSRLPTPDRGCAPYLQHMQRSASGRGLRAGSIGASSTTGFSTPPVAQQAGPSHDPQSARPPAPKDCYYLTQDVEPLGPYAAIARSQAQMSTFPSRLRLGTSTLMQPSSTQEKEALKPAQPSAAAPTAYYAPPAAPAPPSVPQIPSEYGLGRRARTQVNYAEGGGIDLEDEEKDAQSPAPEPTGPTLTARGRLIASRKDSSSNLRAQPAASTSTTSMNGKEKDTKDTSALQVVQNWIPPRSYLDMPPPGYLILAEPARRTKHLYS